MSNNTIGKLDAVLASILLFLTSLPGWAAPAKTPTALEDHPLTIVCLGDSITHAGYPSELEKVLNARVINAGIGGNTSRQGLGRLQRDVLDHKPDIVIAFFGANDSRRDAPRTQVPLAEYHKNLSEIVRRCQSAGAKVILGTLPPIEAEAYYQRHLREAYADVGGLEKWIQQYRAAALNVAATNSIRAVDLYDLLSKSTGWRKPDGVHPTEEGNRLLAEIFAAAVRTEMNLTVSSQKSKSESGKLPNIVFILADDLGFSDIGCYGSEIATPNLDSLAANGLRFTQFYNTARCWPSRASLMTGYYAQQVRRDAVPGIKSGNNGTRPAWAPLVSTLLKEKNYRTYHSGKWHIDSKPLEQGFDRSYLISKGENNYFKADGNTEEGEPAKQTPEYYVTTEVANYAIKCLREHAKEHSSLPFFQYVAFTAPHFPLHAPASDIEKYKNVYKTGWNVMSNARYQRLQKLGIINSPLPPMEVTVGPPFDFPDALVKLGPGEVNRPIAWDDLNDAQREFQAAKMAIHAAMIDRMDQEIGRIIAQLRTMGALDNTLLFFASDNGASAEIMVRGAGHDQGAPPGSSRTFLCLGPGWSSACNTPFRRHKTWVHEGGISTPLIVHWPAGISSKGELRKTPAHLVDIVPTITEVAGIVKPEKVDNDPIPAAPGKSLVPAFSKDGVIERDYLWWAHNKNRAIRVGNWKLVALEDGQWELYDLSKDRSELNNLASKEPDKVRELQALWQKQDDINQTLAREGGEPEAPRKKKKSKANG